MLPPFKVPDCVLSTLVIAGLSKGKTEGDIPL